MRITTNTVELGKVRRGDSQVWSFTIRKRIISRTKSVFITAQLTQLSECKLIMEITVFVKCGEIIGKLLML